MLLFKISSCWYLIPLRLKLYKCLETWWTSWHLFPFLVVMQIHFPILVSILVYIKGVRGCKVPKDRSVILLNLWESITVPEHKKDLIFDGCKEYDRFVFEKTISRTANWLLKIWDYNYV